MEKLEKINNLNFNNYSDIEEYLKPTNPNIQKDFVDSLTNLSNLLSNGLLFINYGIYENISKQNKDNGTQYNIPKDCKLLSNVVSKGIKKGSLKNFKKFQLECNNNSNNNNNSIDIIVTDVDKDNEFIEDDDIFGIDQSMIKEHQDFNFGDASMIFDQSAIFSNLELQGENMANQSMLFMDASGRNMIANEDPTNQNSIFLNINELTELRPIPSPENVEENNSTLVNLADVDNNYLSTSDNESNNSTACWTDDRASGPANDSEGSNTDDDEFLKDEFNHAFSKKKFAASLDTQDLKKLGYSRPNSRQKIKRHLSPVPSTIQVNNCQVFPEPWNEYDDINLAKAKLMKQGFKSSFPHKKLYPVTENPDEVNSGIDDNSSNTHSNKGFVNINRNNDSFDAMNTSFSFIKDDLSITKDIVNKNIKKFNSMGLNNKEILPLPKGNSSNTSFSNLSFTQVSSNNASLNNLRINASSPQPSVSYSTSISNENVSEPVNNFAILQSRFNQPLISDENKEKSISQPNHIWKYKTKQQQQQQQQKKKDT